MTEYIAADSTQIALTNANPPKERWLLRSQNAILPTIKNEMMMFMDIESAK